MAYKYLFQLNGEELIDVSIGVGVVEKLEESLDEAGLHLPLSIRNYEYEMRGLLQITAQDELETQLEFAFLVVGDRVSEGSKYGEWKHDLSLVEYSHKLDNYMVHSLSKTKSLKNENPAPFNNYINTRYNQFVKNAFITYVFLQPIEIVTTYYSDEPIVIPKVRKAYQSTTVGDNGYGSYAQVNAYVETNAIANSKANVSDNAVSWTLPVGDWYIDYGAIIQSNAVGIPNGYQKIYRYYIRVIDREQISVLSLINLVRNNVSKYGGIESKLYFDETRLFDIDPDIEDYISRVEAPQTYIQKATARQVLNSLFIYINSISRLKYVSGGNDILSMDEFNYINGSFEVSDVAGYSSSQEATKLFNKGISWLERALPNDMGEATIETPAQGLYKTVRSTDIQLTDSKFELKLERPIYQPKIFSSKLKNGILKGYLDTSVQRTLFSELELDTTARLINKEEWDLKLITVNFPTVELQFINELNVGMRENKVANLYWKQGDTSIKMADPYGSIVQTQHVFNMVREGFHEYITRNMPEPLFKTVSGTTYMVVYYIVEVNTIYDTNISVSDILDLEFNFEYITLEDVTIASEREDISNSMYYTEGRINQSDKLINTGLASRDAYGMTQRSGVPNKTFTKYHDNFSTLLNIGSQDENGYVIVQRKLELHNEFIKATYMTTKDHNRLSEFKGVDQLYRWSEIPSSNQVNQRIEFYNDYLLALNPNTVYGLQEQVTKHYGDFAIMIMLGTLFNEWFDYITQGKTKTSLAYIRTNGFLKIYPDDISYKYAIAIPVASYGVKGGFVFGFGFDNNQIAGNGLSFDGTNYYNDAVRYTDQDGRFNELWFSLVNKYSNTGDGYTESQRENAYPLVRTNQNDFGALNDIYFKCGAPNIYDALYDALIIEKDSSQSIKVSYQNTIISYEYLKYIFGQKFYSENFIVKNPKVEYNVVKGTNKYLYRYTNGTQYGKFDDLKVKSGWYSKTLLSSANASISENNTLVLSSSMSGVTSWAIGDNDGNLYLACNDNYSGVRFYKQHFRQGVNEIGNKDGIQLVNMNITLSDTITVVSVMGTIHPSDWIDHLTTYIELVDTMSLIQSTDFVITLADNLTVDSTLTADDFEFPVVNLTSLVTLQDSMALIQSTDFVITLSDNVTVVSSLGIFLSDNYVMALNDEIVLVDTIDIIQSTDFVITLADTITVDSTIEEIGQQNVVVDLTATINLTDSITLEQSTDYLVDLTTAITLSDTIELYKSTDFAVNVTSSITLQDTIEVVKSTNFVINMSDTITVSSTIVSGRYATDWLYIGTTGTYNQTVTNVARFSGCNSSSTIDAWLNNNYPVINYEVGYIMRVYRTNEDSEPCSPLHYYYQAVQ